MPTTPKTPAAKPDDVQEAPPATLAEALLALQAAAPTVARGQTSSIDGREYSYADLAAVAAVAYPLLTRFALVFSLRIQFNAAANTYETVGKLEHVPSGEAEESALPLLGRTPQALGSSLTYNRRYLLGTMSGLITEPDDDGAGGRPRTPQPQPQEVPTPQYILDLQAALVTVGLVGSEAGQEVAAFLNRQVNGWEDITPDEAKRATEHFRSLAPKDEGATA